MSADYQTDMAGKTDRFEMRVPPEFMERIDRWRAQQPGIPSRASAIQQLAERSLRADEAAKAERD